MRSSRFACLLLGTLLLVPPTGVYSQDKPANQATVKNEGVIKLESPEWQSVLDRLFGTPDTGLLDGKATFDFRAEDLQLTSVQWATFFNSDPAAMNLADMIAAAEALHSKVRLEGTIDGSPFELKLAGRELKIEGITLTAAQRDALLAELKGIEGLREAKIEALIDGRLNTIHLAGGRERISIRGNDRLESERHARSGRDISSDAKVDVPGLVDIDSRGRALGRIDVLERLERIEKPERGTGRR